MALALTLVAVATGVNERVETLAVKAVSISMVSDIVGSIDELAGKSS